MNTTFKRIISSQAILFIALVTFSFNIPAIFAQGDDCSNALTLTNLSNHCSANAAYSTVGSTTSLGTVPSCWANANRDVWFQFTAVGNTVDVSINGATTNANGTLLNPEIALYSGACGSLSQIGCAIMGAFDVNSVTLFKSNLTIGATYHIRVNGTNPGTFQLCINNFLSVPTTNQDCITSISLCSKNPISVNSFNGPGNNPYEADNSCILSEMQSSWYTWTAANNGTLTLSITPNNQVDDIDFFVFQRIGGNCNALNILRCDAASCLGPGGLTGLSVTETDIVENAGCVEPDNGSVKYIDMVAGSNYGILINNFSGQGGFNLSFGGTGDFQGPKSDFTVSDTLVCGLTTPITFTNTSTGFNHLLWHFGNNASVDTTSSTSPQVINFNTPGVYTVALEVWSANGCDVISYKSVKVLAPPIVNLGNDTVLCPGNSLVLNAENANNGASYAWLPGGQTTQTVTASNAGTFHVTVTNACFSASDSLKLSILSKPDVFLGADTTICLGDSILLYAGNINSYTTYVWLPDGQITPAIIVSNPGIYSAAVTLKGCVTGIDSIQIENEDCELIIPNVFSPNNDNSNDFFIIKGIDKHPGSSLTIYNRWGNKIYESSNYENNWNGSQQSDGVYYYLLNLTKGNSASSGQTSDNFKYGFITIVR